MAKDMQRFRLRRQILRSLLLASVGASMSAQAADRQAGTKGWQDWDSFAQTFLQNDGRVLANAQGQTHSEAQSYALMFALVANDRQRFERILRWTEDNLCAGDLTARLPAWLWGKGSDGKWGVLDSNAASDADLWIAYALAQAGRLWNVRRYRALANVLAARIVREETEDLPGLGPTLLPGPQGFVLEKGKRWRLNPSYVPIQLLRGLGTSTGQAIWEQLCASSQRMVIESSPLGFTPDWVLYVANQGFVADHEGEQKALGAYNAIRVYLWAGSLSAQDRVSPSLLRALMPMADRVAQLGYPPEQIDSVTGSAQGKGNGGFAAALLPLLQSVGAHQALAQQQEYLQLHPPAQDAYYAQCLRLWGQGWIQQKYRFAKNGQLLLPWKGRA